MFPKNPPGEPAAVTDHCMAPAPASISSETPAPDQSASTSPLEKTTPVFDIDDFVRRMMGNEGLARRIIASFLDDCPKQIEKLKTLAAREETLAAGKQAHTIKGAAKNVGGMALGAVASEIEQAGKAGNLTAVLARLPELDLQFSQLKELVERWNASSSR